MYQFSYKIIHDNYISSENDITIVSYFNAKKSLSASHNSTYFPLAKPPFSKESKPVFKYKTSSAKVLSKNSASSFNYKLPGFGIIHFQLDTNSKNGFTLFQFHDHFPKIKTTEEMIHPIWGSVFKTSLEKSLFASELVMHSCLYLSDVSLLGLYSPCHNFLAWYEYLPHERAAFLA